MPRWRNARDKNHLEIYRALQKAGRSPIHGRDADIYCEHVSGHGLALEVKVAKGTMRPIQVQLAGLFKDRYYVVRSVSEALRACGIREAENG
jgi:hypothetical protein